MEKTDNYLDNTNLSKNTDSVAVLSFYSFVNIPEPEALLPKILLITKKKYVKGTIILAKEGFNGSISSTAEDDLHLVIKTLQALTNPKDISVKVNYCNIQPFSKIKIKLKFDLCAYTISC